MRKNLEVESLDEKPGKLPNSVISIEEDRKNLSEFPWVPFHAVCIHVPPPSAKETIYVLGGRGRRKITFAMASIQSGVPN